VTIAKDLTFGIIAGCALAAAFALARRAVPEEGD
jgi:SulP family sulfate permease